MKNWTTDDLRRTAWFAPVLTQLGQVLSQRSAEQHVWRPALERELLEVQERVRGRSESLAKPNLGAAVRFTLEADLEKDLAQRQHLECQLNQVDAMRRQLDELIDPAKILDQLSRLASALESDNATRANVELMLHVEAIRCFPDGRAVVRTCKVGAVPGAVELLTPQQAPETSPSELSVINKPIRPRRRSLRRLDGGEGDPAERRESAHAATDVERLAKLDAEWFWEDEFHKPEATCWAAENAAEVGRLRRAGLTEAKLAEHFGKSVRTIRDALRRAAIADPTLNDLPKKMARPSWSVDHAAEVAELVRQGMTILQIARKLGKSEPTISKALKIARDRGAGQE